jgi:hypothetical protein
MFLTFRGTDRVPASPHERWVFAGCGIPGQTSTRGVLPPYSEGRCINTVARRDRDDEFDVGGWRERKLEAKKQDLPTYLPIEADGGRCPQARLECSVELSLS